MDAETFARATMNEPLQHEAVVMTTYEVFDNRGVSLNGKVALDEYLDSLMAEPTTVKYVAVGDRLFVIGYKMDAIKKES